MALAAYYVKVLNVCDQYFISMHFGYRERLGSAC